MQTSKCVEKPGFCPLKRACKRRFFPLFPPCPYPSGSIAISASPDAGRLTLRLHLSKESRLQNTLLLWGLFLFSRNLLTRLIE